MKIGYVTGFALLGVVLCTTPSLATPPPEDRGRVTYVDVIGSGGTGSQDIDAQINGHPYRLGRILSSGQFEAMAATLVAAMQVQCDVSVHYYQPPDPKQTLWMTRLQLDMDSCAPVASQPPHIITLEPKSNHNGYVSEVVVDVDGSQDKPKLRATIGGAQYAAASDATDGVVRAMTTVLTTAMRIHCDVTMHSEDAGHGLPIMTWVSIDAARCAAPDPGPEPDPPARLLKKTYRHAVDAEDGGNFHDQIVHFCRAEGYSTGHAHNPTSFTRRGHGPGGVEAPSGSWWHTDDVDCEP